MRTEGVDAIFGDTIDLHLQVTLGCRVANTTSAGVGSDFEAVLVGLHDINAGTHGAFVSHGFLSAGGASLDEVKTSNTAATDSAHVNIVVDAATSDTGLEDGIDGFLHRVLKEHGGVVSDA